MSTQKEEKVLTVSLRHTLKAIMQKEVEKIPEYLEGLEPKDRLNVLCKLMPYVFPKVDSVKFNNGEPLDWG